MGTTGANGRFLFKAGLSQGDQLFARLIVDEHTSYRSDHGTGAGWTARTYLTSRKVEDSGSITDFTVTNPLGLQVLKLERDRTLVGWHLVVSLSWDAPESTFDTLSQRFLDASQYLYNGTDGQFLLEQVDIADDAQLWNSADIRFDPDNTRRPGTNGIGGFLGPPPNTILMDPLEPVSCGGGCTYNSDKPSTIIHELGHFAFGLADEYTGILPQRNYCTEAIESSTDAQFKAGGARAACYMYQQWNASKLCSRHNDSAHRGGSLQPGPCWDTINATYEDHAPQRRWLITTPDERGAVAGTLPNLVDGWKPTITRKNQIVGNLCAAFTFIDPAGSAGANGDVWVQPVRGGNFTLGDLKSNGTILAVGVHLGDTIKTTASQVVVANTMCTISE